NRRREQTPQTDRWSKLETNPCDARSIDAGFLFPLAQLRFLLFVNDYDMRCRLAHEVGIKAEPLVQTAVAGPTDILLSAGTPPRVNGGRRGALSHAVNPTSPLRPHLVQKA
ncbi:MAG: hypothetical protein ACKVIQ_20905, partial [Acidimicrobiales bacterium]